MSALDLTVRIGDMTMKNPVMVASGVFGYGDEFMGLADYGELGALVLKTVTREPRAGNPPASRTAETPAGMVNAIGLENVGIEAFLRDKLPAALSYHTNICASIAELGEAQLHHLGDEDSLHRLAHEGDFRAEGLDLG